ncbi:hypothetical protein FKR81_01260 [Lentzea tibetensis]|uniref:Uncharacterized protein n=1 Tax=Lentzea tibetensis TaxID=2591470 RepID=A0A563F2K8_9PSEU|nr:hypothetical protein [Lentzea tibetensis]TWP54216.1 hypothetical protein FKR81_01260 [Lentzea tibetensis]
MGDKFCMNCRERVRGKASGRDRGPDVAWHAQCRRCAELVEDQMELVLTVERRNKPVEIRRCLTCGAERTCQPGWRTRCHLCLDERSTDVAVRRDLVLVDALARYAQPGWTIIAGDVLGLPWTDDPYTAKSHGTFGRHDACGRVQVMSRNRDECRACPPEPGSRTLRGRADDTHYFYLVKYKRVVKFGRGYDGRVRDHLRQGAVPVRVLAARYADTHIAELALKRRHAKDVLRGITGVPESFGTGTEVLPARMSPDLLAFLPASEDVTHRYSPL